MESKGILALNMDGIPLLSIFMHFRDQVFYGIDLIFKPENREKIYIAIAKEMGSNGELDAEGIRWKAGNLLILVRKDESYAKH